MRAPIALAVSVGIFTTTTQAFNLVKREDGQPRVVEFPIQRKEVRDPVRRDRIRMRNRMRRRDSPISVTLDNEETLYYMNGSLGTPAQNFQLHLDTGSSDLWVNVADSSFCRQYGCSQSGTYNANDSSTYSYVDSNFKITYADNSGAQGDYATDKFSFGDVTLDSQQFGIGYESSSQECILGVGYTLNEASVQYVGVGTYPNLPQNLMINGYISSNAYSLWLNDLDANTGSILFGGVNSDRYTGSLETLPIVKTNGFYAEFIIALTGVGANGNSGSLASNLDYGALLDSGTSLTYLPNSIVSSIYNEVGASYDNNQGVAFVNCNLAYSDKTIDFTFSSPTIRVSMSELVIVAGYNGRENICIFGIAPSGDSTIVLGDTFLRSAYVVYDLTGNTISLAQTSFNSTGNNIMEITNSTGVPDATEVSGAVTQVQAATGGARINSLPTGLTTGAAAAPAQASAWNVAMVGALIGMVLVL